MTGLWPCLLGDFPPHDAPLLSADPGPDADGRRHLALVLAYDGAGFSGWQVQPRGRSLQGVVEAALARLCDHPLRVHASGRTDAGVHALGQVASFATTSRLALPRLERGLKSLLPPEIHLRALGPAPPGFHARYSALAKTYDYWLWPAATAPLFLAGRLWPLPMALDPAPMRRALARLIGERDLGVLAAAGSEAKGSSVREIIAASLDAPPAGPWRVRVTATGFLRHVVRNLVGLLVRVGRGQLGPEALLAMIEAGGELRGGSKAPPQGLYLNRVYYRSRPGGGGED
ncbi:MAG: tRNA pseudouridine(38-40) synthase TruA [Thermodesulfobacteriota bacterium]